MILFIIGDVILKNLPMFTTNNGVASLTLTEIPYSARAYVRIQQAADAVALLNECVEFCRAVGANSVFATGHAILEPYPLHTEIVRMRCPKEQLPQTDAVAIPVRENELSSFRDIYNRKTENIANAAYMNLRDAEALLRSGGGYWIVKEDRIIGFGIISGDTVAMLAATEQGCGVHVLSALARELRTDSVEIEVATANRKACDFYDRLGFQTLHVLASWHKVF